MSDVFYLRPLSPPATAAQVVEAASQAGGCFDLYRVEWLRSFLSADGDRMLCWYRSPDAESARSALRDLGSDLNAIWAGEVFEQAPTLALADCNCLLEASADIAFAPS